MVGKWAARRAQKDQAFLELPIMHFICNSSKERSPVECFSTLEEKFRVSARPYKYPPFIPRVTTRLKLKVISRYLEVIPVSFREIAETSRKVTN